MLDHVVSVLSESGMVENVGTATGTTSPALSVQELFPLPVFVAAMLSSGCRPMSDNVGAGMLESGKVENVGVAVEINLICSCNTTEVTCIYADRKASPVFRPPYWIPGMFQIWSESA